MKTLAFLSFGPTTDSLYAVGSFALIVYGLVIYQRIRRQRRSKLNPPGGILSNLKKRNP